MGKFRTWLVILVIVVLAGAGYYFLRPITPVADEITSYSQDWPLPNFDYGNTRATTGSSINSATVSSLQVKWTLPLPGIGEWGAANSNPIIQGQTAYFQDMKSNVFAIDLTSGTLKWKKEYDSVTYGPNGLVVSRNRVYVIKGHYEVAALDMKGQELWSTKLSDRDTVGIDIQPVEYNGLVYVSTVPGTENANFYTGGGMGILYALDYKTGKIKWSFNTIENGSLWGNAQVNSGGGAWFTPAVDTKSGLMFWGIGNPAPWPGTKEFPNATSRPGPNLYTNSILAMKHDTGVLTWYQQAKPHDLFDLDLQNPPVLATVDTGAGPVDIVIASGKLGKVIAYDRTSGRLLWTTPVGKHQNDDLNELPDGITEVYPGPLGGVETPLAYKDGIVYAPILDMPAKYSPTSIDPKSLNFDNATGALIAIDAKTGQILWTKELPSMNVGAATVVNDLVFTSTLDGKVYAFNRLEGKKIWEYQAPGGINAWPAVAGKFILFPVGMGPNPALVALGL